MTRKIGGKFEGLFRTGREAVPPFLENSPALLTNIIFGDMVSYTSNEPTNKKEVVGCAAPSASSR